jgi:hypothetical protein
MKVIVDDILMEDFRVQYQEQNKILEAETEFSVFPKFNIIKVRSRKKQKDWI